MSRVITNDEFIERLKRVNPCIIPLEPYRKGKEKLLVKCQTCNYEWKAAPNKLLCGRACPKCAGNMRKSNSEFLSRLKSINQEILPLEEYKSRKTKLLVRCIRCGYEWNVLPNSLLCGSGCPKCNHTYRRTHDEFVNELKSINTHITVLGSFTGMNVRILVRCNVCGNEWKTRPADLINGKGCLICSGRAKKTHEQFVAEMKEVNPNIIVKGEYHNYSTKIFVQCNICNTEWYSTPDKLLHGRGCPNCSHSQTSFVEQLLLLLARDSLGNNGVLWRDRNEIGKEIDIYIPSLKLAIEYGSWFYHRDRGSIDKEKKSLCCNKGIRLITIYDGCNENIEHDESMYVFSCNLGENQNTYKIVTLFRKILHEYGVRTDWDDKINQIIIQARMNCRHKTTTEFNKELEAINPSIVVLEDYQSDATPLLLKCQTCGGTWKATPNNLLHGKGCPFCAGNRKKTTEQFIHELSVINPNVTVLGSYANAFTKIPVKCSVCGHSWKAAPTSLLAKHGCPVCGKKKSIPNSSLAKRKTVKRFISELSSKNPTIEILNDYQDSKTKVKAKCKICEHEWEALPNNLLSGTQCPQCSRKKASKAVLCIETNQTFDSIGIASRITNATRKGIRACCNGEQNTAGGYHWMYTDEINRKSGGK